MKTSIKKFLDRVLTSDLLMHIMYGAVVASFLIPFFYKLFTGQEAPGFQFSAGVWAAQTWFYYFAYRKANNIARKLRETIIGLEGTFGAVHEINGILLEKMEKIHPEILKEAGITIKKKKKVNTNSV